LTVTKYRSVEEMPRVVAPRDATLAARIRELWQRSFRLAAPTVPRGVSRFRDIAEADQARSDLRARRIRERVDEVKPRRGASDPKGP
jgi:hypothetical protein